MRTFIKLEKEKNSWVIKDRKIIDKIISDENFPFLISFPRTGSHWLRAIMELYFRKPSLVRAFYFKKTMDFTCYHRHDIELEIKRSNIIYLYRNPVDTIYSQLNYYEENINDRNKIEFWTKLYAKHLNKWLVEENFTRKKTIITYEGLKNNTEKEFQKICKHFNKDFSSNLLKKIIKKTSKTNLKTKTKHDNHVINVKKDYEINRNIFYKNYSKYIFDIILRENGELEKYIRFE